MDRARRRTALLLLAALLPTLVVPLGLRVSVCLRWAGVGSSTGAEACATACAVDRGALVTLPAAPGSAPAVDAACACCRKSEAAPERDDERVPVAFASAAPDASHGATHCPCCRHFQTNDDPFDRCASVECAGVDLALGINRITPALGASTVEGRGALARATRTPPGGDRTRLGLPLRI